MPRCSISLSYHSRLVPPPTLCARGGGFRPVLALCQRGYQKQILIGGDFARKSMSAHYGKGGLGLKFILNDWRPRFLEEAREAGFDGEALLHDFFVDNPARYLAFA